jgi:protease-4
MFVRRHPVLFFLLVMCGIGAFLVISLTALMVIGFDRSAFRFGEQVGVIEISGVITDPKPSLAKLKEFRKNTNVKAIVLRIDSPGGGVGPSQEIYAEVNKTKQEKKVVASMGSIAASGGYYVASAADHIMANPGTITGSIGVVMEFANLEELFNKIGISAFVLKSGEYKDVGFPFREMTAQEKALLQGFIDNVHTQFVAAVAEAREMPQEEIAAIADGRIFSGEQARELGLLDSLGNLEDAIAMAAELGGIRGEPSVFFAEEDKFSLLEDLLGISLQQTLDAVTRAARGSGYIWLPPREGGNG